MIPDEAVEAARRVMARGAYQMSNDELPYEHVARAALEAAAPLIAAKALEGAAPEVRYVDLTTGEKDVLDEVVARNAYVHLEAMDDNHWWMIITSGGQSVHVNLYTKRAKITAHAEVEHAETPAAALRVEG